MAMRLTHTGGGPAVSRELLAELLGVAAVVVGLAGIGLAQVAMVPIIAMMLGAIAIAVMPDRSPDEAADRRARREEYLAVAFGLAAILLGFLELIFSAGIGE